MQQMENARLLLFLAVRTALSQSAVLTGRCLPAFVKEPAQIARGAASFKTTQVSST